MTDHESKPTAEEIWIGDLKHLSKYAATATRDAQFKEWIHSTSADIAAENLVFAPHQLIQMHDLLKPEERSPDKDFRALVKETRLKFLEIACAHPHGAHYQTVLDAQKAKTTPAPAPAQGPTGEIDAAKLTIQSSKNNETHLSRG